MLIPIRVGQNMIMSILENDLSPSGLRHMHHLQVTIAPSDHRKQAGLQTGVSGTTGQRQFFRLRDGSPARCGQITELESPEPRPDDH